MPLTLYGLKSCDTCRKALKYLENKGLEVTFHDVRQGPLDPAQIALFCARFGEEVINRRSTTWRALSEEERKKQAADLLSAHPTLMKRPVIDHDGALSIGWGPEVQARFASD